MPKPVLIFLAILIILKDNSHLEFSLRAYDADDCAEIGMMVQEYLEAHPGDWIGYHLSCEIEPPSGPFIKHSA